MLTFKNAFIEWNTAMNSLNKNPLERKIGDKLVKVYHNKEGFATNAEIITDNPNSSGAIELDALRAKITYNHPSNPITYEIDAKNLLDEVENELKK